MHWTVKKTKSQNMAIYDVFLIAVCISATSAAYEPCGVGQCKLVPVERDFALTFQQLASEKGVRLVHLTLEIGNDTFHPLETSERFLGKKWIWANTIREPMFLLATNYADIASLGLLKRQKRSVDVRLEEHPAGCLGRLNVSCQDNVVGVALLENLTKLTAGNRLQQTDCVCTLHMHKQSSSSGKRKAKCCCVQQKITEMSDTIIRCGIALENDWLESWTATFNLLGFIILLYCPVIPLLLPDCLLNLQHECEKEIMAKKQIQTNQVSPYQQDIGINTNEPTIESQVDREGDSNCSGELDNQFEELLSARLEEKKVRGFEIPVDDASPVTLWALVRDYVKELPSIEMNFNLRLLFLCFIVFPFFLYLRFAVMLLYEMEAFQESYKKNYKCRGSNVAQAIVCFIAGFSWKNILFILNSLEFIGCVALFVILTFVRPTDFLYTEEFGCFLGCGATVSMGQEILLHLRLQRESIYDFTFYILNFYVSTLKTCPTLGHRASESRQRRALRSLCVLLSVFPGLLIGAVWGVICLLILLIVLVIPFMLLSPIGTLFLFCIRKGKRILDSTLCCVQSPYKCLSFFLILFPIAFYVVITVSLFSITRVVVIRSAIFITHIILLTTMGLVLNVEFVTLYTSFILVVARNIYLCYSNFQSKYKDVKGMISMHWEDETTNLAWLKCSNGTIPKKLFWFVCEKQVLPLRTEICFMLRNVALILFFLFISFNTILMFETMENMSVLISTILVLISGEIPKLILQGLTKTQQYSGWKKIQIDNKIKAAVHEYVLAKMKEQDYEKPYSYDVRNP